MSAYETASHGELLDYHATSALPHSDVFGPYLPSSYGPDAFYEPQLSNGHNGSDLNYQIEAEFVQHDAFVGARQTVAAMRAPQAPQMASYPSRGPLTTVANASQQLPRKRKASPDSEDEHARLRKRSHVAHLQLQDVKGEYYDFSNQPSPYSPFIHTPTGSVFHAGGPMASPRPGGHHYSTSTASQVSLTAPSPHTPA